VALSLGSPGRAHREVLYFASPFFQAALSGSWRETGRPSSMSSVVTISHGRDQFRGGFAPTAPLDHDQQDVSSDTASDSSSPVEVEHPAGSGSEASTSGASESEPEEDGDAEHKAGERKASLSKLRGPTEGPACNSKGKGKATDPRTRCSQGPRAITKKRRKKQDQDAVIVLQEERVTYLSSLLPAISLVAVFRPISFMISSNTCIHSARYFLRCCN